jgi:hypothetical protein
MGSKYLTASTGYRDATALMQGGKQYENLSEGLNCLIPLGPQYRFFPFCS